MEKHEDLKRAYNLGWNHGHGIACHNVPKLGQKLWTDGLGHVVVDAENIREVHESLCWSAQENSRSYSPFEFTAAKFNRAGDGDDYEIVCEDGEYYVANNDGPLDAGFETEELAREWIDQQPTSEELWEAFEEGVGAAIHADLETYTDEDYGIETEAA